MRLFFAVLAGLTFALPLQAGQGLQSLVTLDETKSWQAVGRLNIGQSGFCTGTLIAPDLVLTAAHCLYDLETGRRVDDSEIEFLAGWRNGRASAYRGVRQSVAHFSYAFRTREDQDRIGADLALLELDQPIRHPSIKPLDAAPRAARGQELAVVSYAHDRANAPSLQKACHVLAKEDDLYVTSCDVDFGSSGAPVLVVENGQPAVMSVVSAKAEWNTQKVSLAEGVERRIDEMLVQLKNRSREAQSTSAGGKRLIFKSGMQPSGARFVKP
ncbi:MAG: trypsin-like serine protease [Litoreibacter sp.]|nr:trypsin-like serine protease [Litoreibacter sp.]MCY4336765.1 trypsin-like serine protease [Litoreibacter sp.]